MEKNFHADGIVKSYQDPSGCANYYQSRGEESESVDN